MLQSEKSNLHEDLPFGTSPPRPSVNKMTSKFYTEEHDICDGEVKLLRTKQSGDVWQMRCWISLEKKYVKKSLRTKDFEEAKSKGRKLYYSMMGKLDAGQKLFTITSSELVEKYLDMQQDRVDGGFITQQRRNTIITQCNHFMEFVGKDRKMDTITRERYKDYYLFRRKKKPDVKVPTLLNERSTIGHIYKWSLEQGYITQDRLPVWAELKVSNIGSRTAFTIEDYQTLYGYLRNYTNGSALNATVLKLAVRDIRLALAIAGSISAVSFLGER